MGLAAARRIGRILTGRARFAKPPAPPTVTPSTSLRTALAALGTLLATWAGVVWLTGGVVFDLGGVRVSSRSAARPALLAALCVAAWLWGQSAKQRRHLVALARRRGDRYAPAAAVVLAVSVAATSALFGGHVAGGADASGYVSQSRLWADGRLRVDAPDVVQADWPTRGWLVAPLGYAPSHVPGALGPTYAPGLPWLMAAGAAVLGEAGRYVWTPLCVGLLVWGTFLLARRDAPPLVALAAALLVATSPPVLFSAMQTMSDLPAAALWLASLLILASPRPGSRLASGALAALALVVRPNLVFAAGAVWAADLAAGSAPSITEAPAAATYDTRRAHLTRAACWVAPVAIAALAIAAVNTALWGSPAASGYGATEDLFRAAHVPGNLARLWRWTVETRGYWTIVGLAGLAWTAVARDRRRAWPAAALVGAVATSYVVYAVFEEWWYLRFYLPAWPVLAAAAAWGAWRVLARWNDDAAALAVAAAAMAIGAGGITTASAAGTFELWKGEQRYAAVAAYVDREAPPATVVLSVQHSGAIAYYARRTIGRWDYVAPDDLDAFCARLAAGGRDVWLVVDDWEEAPFRQRFASSARGRLDWAPRGEARVGTARVRVYDLTSPTRAVGPALIPVLTQRPWPWTRSHQPSAAK